MGPRVDKARKELTEDMRTKHNKQLDRIVTDPKILVGKPVVKGTRIPVELVLAHLAENPDLEDLFAAYPRLTLDDVRGCLAYATRVVETERPRRRVSPGTR